MPAEEDRGELALAEANGLVPVYTIAQPQMELRQGELLSNLAQYIYDPVAELAEEIRHDYAIVLSQDCDLLRDYGGDQGGQVLNSVLLYEIESFDIARGKFPQGRDIRKQILNNSHERYHFLESVPVELDFSGRGLPDLIIDFRRYFTVQAKEIYRQCAIIGDGKANRHCRLEPPYREHLQSRAAFYFQRVGLPGPHTLEA